METEVKRLDKRVEGEKRMRFPFTLEWDCPGCGVRKVKDFSRDDHLSYPTWGVAEEEVLYCDDCGHEEPVLLRVDVTMEVVNTEEG